MTKLKIKTIDELPSILARKVFQSGSKEVNLLILQELPTNVKDLMKKLNLTKVPVNNHLNELEKLGLLSRERSTGAAYPTEITVRFLDMHTEMTKIMDENMTAIITKIVE